MSSRRSWGFVAVAGALLLGACGGDDKGGGTATPSTSAAKTQASATSAPQAAATSAPATTQAPGTLKDLPSLPVAAAQVDDNATVRIAFAFVELKLDPHKVQQLYLTQYLYDSLFQIDKDKNLLPGLATKYAFSDDKKSVTLTLRDGATFSDGTPVDADAVKASLDRGRTLPDSTVKADLANIANVTVVDPHAVRLDLNEPDVTLIYTLATHAGSVINPKAIAAGTDLSTTAAGSTPYDIAEFDPGKKVVFERRSGATHWDPAAFKIKRLEISLVTDPNTVMNGLRTGAFEAGDLVIPPDQAKSQLGNDFNFANLVSDSMVWIWLRDTRPAWQPQAVRQAAISAIDRKSIADKALLLCSASSQMFPPGSPAYIDGYDPYSFDPAKAKAMLAGATPQVEFLVAPTQANETKFAQVAQQQLADVGFNVTITPMNLPEASPQFNSGNRDGFIQGSSSLPDAGLTIKKFFFGPPAMAGPGLKDTLQAKLKAANALPLGSPERAAALQDLQKTAMDWAVFIPVCRIAHNWGVKKNLLGFPDAPWQSAGYFSARYFVVTK
jgi:peptide/nickel transport system substrate-binding protein